MKTQDSKPKYKGNDKVKYFHIDLVPGMNFAVAPHFAEEAAWMHMGFLAGVVPTEPAPHPRAMVKVFIKNEPIENTPEAVLRYALQTAKMQARVLSPYITENGKRVQLKLGSQVVLDFERGKPVRKEYHPIAEAMALALGMSEKDRNLLLGVNGTNGTKPSDKPTRIWFRFSVEPENMKLSGTATCTGAVRYDVHVCTDFEKLERGELVASGAADPEGKADLSWSAVYDQTYIITAFDANGQIAELTRTPRKDYEPREKAAKASEPVATIATNSNLKLPDDLKAKVAAEMVIKGFKAEYKTKQVIGHAECDGAIGWAVVAMRDKKTLLDNGEGQKAKFKFAAEAATIYILQFVGPEKAKATMRFQVSGKGELLTEENFPAK